MRRFLKQRNVVASIPRATLLSSVLSVVILVCSSLPRKLSCSVTAQHSIPVEFNFENPVLTGGPDAMSLCGPFR